MTYILPSVVTTTTSIDPLGYGKLTGVGSNFPYPLYQNNHADYETIHLILEKLDAISNRLAILEPHIEKLEKFKNLKNIYEQYQIMEALLKEES
jgi:hypothetical protein